VFIHPRQFAAGLLMATASVLFAGCGGSKRYEVSGRVTYDGRPLPAGVIYFDPDVTRRNDGPQGYAIIKDGAYSTAAKGGRGVAGGPYVVRIEGFDGKPGAELPLGKSLFTGYQERRDLPQARSEQDFAVPKGGRN
jgi:hypothetical protein